MTGYPDKTPSSKPPIESVAGYKTGQAPAAAKFNVGISSREGAQAAQDARREHSRQLTDRWIGPQTGHRAKQKQKNNDRTNTAPSVACSCEHRRGGRFLVPKLARPSTAYATSRS
jgi:hypothetical protein